MASSDETHRHIDMALVKALEFRLDPALFHPSGKFDDHVFRIDKDLVAAEIHRPAVETRHLRVELGRLKSFLRRHPCRSARRWLNDDRRTSFLNRID